MSASPFLSFPIRNKRDIVQARHRARQLALLLKFSAREQACIAAATFEIACRARLAVGRFQLCFEIEECRLRVFARPIASDMPTTPGPVNRIASLPEAEGMLRLEKTLPEPPEHSLTDLAWLVHNGDKPGAGLFDEVVKQNQEILMLLHELHVSETALQASRAA